MNEKIKGIFVQFMKFAIVGGISCVIDFAVYTVMIKVFNIHYLISAFFGFMISLIFNYFASMKFVFVRKDDISKKKEFTVFAILSVIGLLLNELIILVCVEGYRMMNPISFTVASYTFDFDYWIEIIAKVVATGIVMIYNFVTRKIFIEKKD